MNELNGKETRTSVHDSPQRSSSLLIFILLKRLLTKTCKLCPQTYRNPRFSSQVSIGIGTFSLISQGNK